MRKAAPATFACALLLAAAGLAAMAGGCSEGGGESIAAAATPEDAPAAAQSPTPVREEGPPRLSLVVRAALVPGRPVPYRLTFENRTHDVLVPIAAEATDGAGGASWGRTVVGEVVYDEDENRYVETPLAASPSAVGLVEAVPDTSRALFRSAVFPGETLVHEFEVRYDHAGSVDETVRLLFHRLGEDEFDQLCYVRSGDGLPRRYEPIGNLQDRSARTGALLAGFYLRAPGKPESVTGSIRLELPELPPAIVTRIEKAGFEAERAMAADWAGGWLAGDGERSVLVTTAGATRPLPGVPFEALQVIDDAGADVSFCITGAKREDVAPFFAGREIVPYKCLHVSVPRTHILPTLEKIGASGLAVRRVDFQSREALDVVKRDGTAKVAPLPSPVASPAMKPSATPTPPPKTPVPATSPASTDLPSPTPTPAPTSTKTPASSPTKPPTPSPTKTPAPSPAKSPAPTPTATPTEPSAAPTPTADALAPTPTAPSTPLPMGTPSSAATPDSSTSAQ